MTVLRKACRNCTVSKRKCVVQLPKCLRCTEKGLVCSYDLEPLGPPTSHPEAATKFSYNPSNCDSPGYCVMKTIRFRNCVEIDPAICRPGHADAVQFVRLGYTPIPELIRTGKHALFIHPKLQFSKNTTNHLSVFREAGRGGVTRENFGRLIQIDVTTASIEEALTALQALLIYLAEFLFPSNEADQQPDIESFLSNTSIITNWTQNLIAQTGIKPRGQSPWQQWLFGESLRRTVLMSYALYLTVSSFKYGYCSNWLFLESLPFDERPGLWMAESPQAWIAAARARTGEEVGEQLSSLHSFSESVVGASDLSFCGDMFFTLVAVSHNGGPSQA